MRLLNDPRLPLDDIRDVMASIAGRIPADLERTIARALTSYQQNITSVIATFPAQKITAEIDKVNSRLPIAEKDIFEMMISPVLEVCSKYRHGVRGMLRSQVQMLLSRYLEVESHFQVGQYDKVVSQMRQLAGPGADMSVIVDRIFAHKQHRKRNVVVTCLLDELVREDPRIVAELKTTLLQLTNLSKQENSPVCLKARTILIESEKPSYELRYNHAEKMFLDAVSKTDDSASNLYKMITDDSAIFDVLGEFFYHADNGVRQAALEVYVRRAFTSYDMTLLEHLVLPAGPSAVNYEFILPSAHPTRSVQSVRPPSDDNWSMTWDSSDECKRTGVMAAFLSFEDFVSQFDSVMELFDNQNYKRWPPMDLEGKSALRVGTPNSWDDRGVVNSPKTEPREPTNIINIAIRMTGQAPVDQDIAARLGNFCQTNSVNLCDSQIRRITFIILYTRSFPRYFTYRSRSEFQEDRIYRHLEPALAFQLELNRLKNYHLDPVQTANHKMHLYLGRAKVSEGREVSDYR